MKSLTASLSQARAGFVGETIAFRHATNALPKDDTQLKARKLVKTLYVLFVVGCQNYLGQTTSNPHYKIEL